MLLPLSSKNWSLSGTCFLLYALDSLGHTILSDTTRIVPPADRASIVPSAAWARTSRSFDKSAGSGFAQTLGWSTFLVSSFHCCKLRPLEVWPFMSLCLVLVKLLPNRTMSFLSLYASSSQTLYILISLVTSEISPPACLTAPR